METTRGLKNNRVRAYGEQDLMDAVEAVKSGMTLHAAQRKYGVARSTIKNYSVDHGHRPKIGRRPFMTPEEEDALATFLQEHCKNTGQTLQSDEFKTLVIKYATENIGKTRKNIPKTFCEKWRRLFFERHPEVKALMTLKRRSNAEVAALRSQMDIPIGQCRRSGKTKPVEGVSVPPQTRKEVEIKAACQHSCCQKRSPAAPLTKDSSSMLLIRSFLVDNLNFNHTQAEAVLDFTIRTSKRGNTPQPTAARSSKAHARSVHIPPVAESEDEAMDEPEDEYVVKSVRVNHMPMYALPL
ncbi:hypothetical protein RvY_14377 [Ramazzottius varieornatus]|uniref:HTH psq-type domain-containing protein n=1 Tax=Ramazzottius varieornatus TaxID=947166 RepID=A0A1D1VYE8_RAMVA|nr:hypothetical protein RvY_14377 [Ramazzottius varieornatus]